MKPVIRYPILILAVSLLCSAGATAAVPAYTTTYTITVQEDGSALWQIEYRTLLATDSDLAAFENYTLELPSVYLPQVQDLMQRSAAQASVAASRHMAISNVTGNAIVQTSPTGRYGVVVYSFAWSGFARPDGTLTIGDAFSGGLYLAKGNTLILRPYGWTVSRAEPAPDDQRDGLVWYGLRTFGPGELRVTVEKPSFPLVPVIVILFIVSLLGAGYMIYQRRKEPGDPGRAAEPDEPAARPLSEEEAGRPRGADRGDPPGRRGRAVPVGDRQNPWHPQVNGQFVAQPPPRAGAHPESEERAGELNPARAIKGSPDLP